MALIISFLLLFVALVHFSYQSNHFLSLLLTFELMVLGVFIGCLYVLGNSSNVMGYYFCLVVLAIGVAETVIGLALMVSCARFGGMGMKNTFSVLGF